MDKTFEAIQPNGERYDYNALCLATGAQLETVMRQGVQPDIGSLVGWEFKGYKVFERLTVPGLIKFKVGFFLEDPERDPALGISGYNVQTHPNTLGEPWIDKTKKGDPIRHGWFDVYPVSLSETDNKYPNSLLLNYASSPRNFALDPSRAFRDYLVQVYADNPDLLLGKSYAAFGQIRSQLTFFVLERHNESIL